jgi:hypothetical protein
MIIYMLAFLSGVIVWLLIVISFFKLLNLLRNFFGKFISEFSALILSYLITLGLSILVYTLVGMWPHIVVPRSEWRHVATYYFVGSLFTICLLQLREFLLERQKK